MVQDSTIHDSRLIFFNDFHVKPVEFSVKNIKQTMSNLAEGQTDNTVDLEGEKSAPGS